MKIWIDNLNWEMYINGKPYGAKIQIETEISEKMDLKEITRIVSKQIEDTVASVIKE